jgi:hypothetical protein
MTKEEAAVKRREFRRSNREKENAYRRGWYLRHKAEILARVRANPNTPAIHRKSKMKMRYGLTQEALEEMIREQGGGCAICGTREWRGRHRSPAVDHDHATGKIRGVLCDRCNMAAGLIDDSPARARALAEYLERSRS